MVFLARPQNDDAIHTPDPITDTRYTLHTSRGTIYLRDRCPAAFIAQLRPDEGLCAFARRPEREHELLLKIAGCGQGEVALAYTGDGLIVGQITFADAGEWWRDAGACREVAIETSANWRQQGIAQALLQLVAGREDLERWILLALGFSWHWATAQLGLTRIAYREMLARMAAPYGFTEYLTNEPNISDDPFNILLARLGRQVQPAEFERFYDCLLRSDMLPGM